MKIVIVGAGALGRLFGSYLVREGNEIILVDIDSKILGELQQKGIGLVEQSADHPDDASSFPVQALHSAKSLTAADLVILLVKSQATLDAIQDVQHLISDTCPLLCIQAGLGNLEIARQYVSEDNILLGVTFMSGMALSNARVRKGGVAKTYIGELDGSLSERLEYICTMFNQCGIKTSMTKRILGRLWSKVIVFSAINPLTAILQVPNGALTTRDESSSLIRRLLDEAIEVAEAGSIELAYPDLYELLKDTCAASTKNLSSMLQDILNGSPTEIDSQNGAICRFAKEYGVSVPTHRTMVEMIKLLECWRSDMDGA